VHSKVAKSVRRRCSGRHPRVDDTLCSQLEINVATHPLHMVMIKVSFRLRLVLMVWIALACVHTSPHPVALARPRIPFLI